ncbi:hypothetical protein CF15_02935 [Pyrodictium occultum]|uniref:Uncharacterized protein n=1 Tax=Pyrodictium occultum TaxID=2309 RepID=A0A0V8RUS6_PYROC|nr:hypothetical protein CF15_02935 [Pyrodictium occultum]
MVMHSPRYRPQYLLANTKARTGTAQHIQDLTSSLRTSWRGRNTSPITTALLAADIIEYNAEDSDLKSREA